MRALALATLLLGCLPNVDSYVVDGRGDAGPRRDAGPRPDAGARPDADVSRLDGGRAGDAGIDAACTLEPTCPAGCPKPWLLAAVQDLPPTTCGGQVLRWSLSEGSACVCAPYRAGVQDLVFSVGYAPPNTLVTVAEDETTVAFDADTGRQRWVRSYTGQPGEVFPIADPGGAPRVAVSGRRRGDTMLQDFRFYDLATGEGDDPLNVRDIGVGINAVSATSSAFDASWLRVTGLNSDYHSADVDPWDASPLRRPFHINSTLNGIVMESIVSFHDGRQHRVAFAGRRMSTPNVYHFSRITDEGDNAVPAPTRCGDRSCEFLHAVPDPTVFSETFAICAEGTARSVVRVSAVDECTPLLQAGDLDDDDRVFQLAIALARDSWTAP